MDKDSLNSIYRLNTILTLFQASKACYSIKDIAEILDIPVSVIRKDILMLHTHKNSGITFFAKEEQEWEDVVERLQSGKADELQLCANARYHDEVYLPLSELELSCLNDFLDGKRYEIGRIHKNYVIKPMYNQARANMQVKVEKINQLIQAEETIEIVYKRRDGKIMFLTIRPLGLIHNAMEDLYYVVTIQDGKMVFLRLDRIRKYEISDEKIEMEDQSLLEQLPNIWGMDLGEKIHVKIKILKEANVQYKVKRDLALRINGRWTQDGEDLYFEDDVIGVNGFRSWINGYGSSVLVMEPESLRKEIIESARKRISFYQEKEMIKTE